MQRKITGFRRDDEGHWVARLDCGHGRHVRHIPPLAERPWALTDQGRREKVGLAVDCKRCDRGELPDDPSLG